MRWVGSVAAWEAKALALGTFIAQAPYVQEGRPRLRPDRIDRTTAKESK